MALKPLLAIGIIAIFGITSAYSVEFLPLLDKSTYSVGDWATITVQDSSKNVLDDAAESILVTVQSNSEPEIKQLELAETGPDTGVFSGSILLSSISGNESSLHVQSGDLIHAMYMSYIQTATIKKSGSGLSPILVSTDKDDYKVGELIVVSGSVTGGDPSFDVNLTIVDPHGNTIHTETIDLSYILSFSAEIDTELTEWHDSGNYKVLVWHESEETQAETVFSLSSTYGQQETTNSIPIFNSPINLDYSITSGKLTLVKANLQEKSLVFSINVGSGGHLTVEIPRYIMDAQDEEGDAEYTVLMDYRNAEHVEKSNPNERTITVPFIHNTRTIEIVGTFLELDPSPPSASTVIPDWVRNNAEWWSKDLIGETDFVSGIEYLIIQGVIQLPIEHGEVAAKEATFVPAWIKDTAGWWAEGLVSDSEFVNGLKFLISKGIITV